MKTLLSINIGSKGFAEEYIAACAEVGIESKKIRSAHSCITLSENIAKLHHKGEEIKVKDIDYTFIRVAGKYTLMTSLIARLLKASNVPLNEYIYLDHTQNEEKITQMLQLTIGDLPIPRTVLFALDGFEENKDVITEHVSLPAVLKANGSKGSKVWKVDTEEELAEQVEELQGRYETVMLQEYIPNTYDIRALYVYGDIIGAIKRSSADGFYNNVSKGGATETITLTEEEEGVAKRACEVLGRNFGGVDIVRSEKGPLLFEVNLGPQIYGFEGATGIDVPKEILSRIKRLLDNKTSPN